MAHPQLRPPDPMRRLGRLNRTGVFLGTLVLGLAGLFLPGFWGGLVLLIILAALAFLMRQTWALTPPPLRVARLVILAVFALIALTKIT